jgi:hypothetical protein
LKRLKWKQQQLSSQRSHSVVCWPRDASLRVMLRRVKKIDAFRFRAERRPTKRVSTRIRATDIIAPDRVRVMTNECPSDAFDQDSASTVRPSYRIISRASARRSSAADRNSSTIHIRAGRNLYKIPFYLPAGCCREVGGP